ncbi:MAG: hypothetical protein AB1778_08435 [Candidatus Bipolaricaulota bacterium]
MERAERIDVAALFARHPFVHEILARLEASGFAAVLIGGVVRDGLLASWGQTIAYPPGDVDVATAAMPDDLRRLFADRPMVGVGEEFGVVVIVAPDGRAYEVATFRVEGEYDGRWPGRVELGRDLAGDVCRRDLTMNGLAATAEGHVIDLVGGVADLRARLVKAIGDPAERFKEDALRLLRTVRFVCQIDGTLDPETERAARDASAGLSRISRERVRDELLRILATPRAATGVELLDDLGLLEHVLPEVLAGKGVEQPEAYHPEGDVFLHTVAAVRVADAFVRDPIVKLAVLLHDVGKPAAFVRSGGANMGGHCALGAAMARRAAERLRLRRTEIARLSFLVKNHMRIADLPEMGRGRQVRFLSEGVEPGGRLFIGRYPLFSDLLALLVADCEASAHRASGWAPILSEALRIALHVETVGTLQRARQIIHGGDLLALGVPAGPRLGALLDALHDRVLAGELADRDAALQEARRLAALDCERTFAGPRRDRRPGDPNAAPLR